MVDFTQHAAGVAVALANGSVERGDVLIGADGLHSTIRARLFGRRPPRYAGYTAWRAVVQPNRDLLPADTGFEAWGCGARFGCAHIRDGRIYWFAVRNALAGAQYGPLGSPTGPRAALLRCFGDWQSPVPELIAETAEAAIRRDDIHDRSPLPGPWGTGCITLLGDAAHPMTPNLGQGACQAIEDAVTLAGCLAEADRSDPATALRRYEDRRRSRVNGIVRRSRMFGRIGQVENPLLCRLRDVVAAAVPVDMQMRQLLRIIGDDPPAGGRPDLGDAGKHRGR
ncbi:MAG: FAD-dependent monooxygenase [Thermomicrobiales bacterium]|nr:FAD-dependent monooxygenase [Thermomicrobiales bacterium]